MNALKFIFYVSLHLIYVKIITFYIHLRNSLNRNITNNNCNAILEKNRI